MRTIITKYLPATNTRGSRIKATEQRNYNSITISYDYALDGVAVHKKAVDALQELSGTNYKYVVGELKSGFVFVAID